MSKRTGKKKTASDASRPLFEALEPRVLFSADVQSVLLDPSFADVRDSNDTAIEIELPRDESAITDDLADVRHELVFVDTGVEDYEQLVKDLQSATSVDRWLEVVLLDAERDGVEQITDVLRGYQDLDAIQIVSHGAQGAVQLGSTWLDAENLDSYSSAIASWGDALSQNADLVFYGCDLAGGERGAAFADSLGRLTGADVAASIDATGSALLGGDWDLEYYSGSIETGIAFSADAQDDWLGLLKPPQVADITTDEDTQSGGIVVDRHAADGAEVSHFRISGITDGSLFQADGTTAINNGDFILVAEGQAGLRFTPTPDSTLAGGFDAESSLDGTTVEGGLSASTIIVTPVGDTPVVADITTVEDTQSGLIVLDRAAVDGPEVTHFRISGITGGSLFQADGSTAVSNGDYISYAQGQAGLRFTPSSNVTADGSFGVESSEDGTNVAAQSGVATSTISITPVGDTPVVPDITTFEDTQTGLIVVDRHPTDGAEVSHFRVSGITNGTLYQADGSTAISDGDYISYAEGQSGLRFTPDLHTNLAGSFGLQSSEDGSSVAAQTGVATSTINVTPVGDTPVVADITTVEDTQSGLIVLDRAAVDSAEVGHFRIGGITNGTLFQADGSTAISNGDYISYAQGQAGLRFTPDPNTNLAGSFGVESSEDGTSVAAQSGVATSTINITPVGDTPVVSDTTTFEDTQTGLLVVDRAAVDGPEVTHFRISGITNGTVYQADGTTVVNDGDYVTYAQGQAGLRFTPDLHTILAGGFSVQSSEDGSSVAAQSGVATSTINLTPVGDTPVVADITTVEETQSGLIVLDRHATDGAEVSHFRISAITGGTLFQADGSTAINDGDYITYAQGQAGLRFTPGLNATLGTSFGVESSEDGSSVAAQSGVATSTISITPVGDTPVVPDITTFEETQSGLIVVDRHATDGPEVSHFRISGITGGTLFQADGTTAISNHHLRPGPGRAALHAAGRLEPGGKLQRPVLGGWLLGRGPERCRDLDHQRNTGGRHAGGGRHHHSRGHPVGPDRAGPGGGGQHGGQPLPHQRHHGRHALPGRRHHRHQRWRLHHLCRGPGGAALHAGPAHQPGRKLRRRVLGGWILGRQSKQRGDVHHQCHPGG